MNSLMENNPLLEIAFFLIKILTNEPKNISEKESSKLQIFNPFFFSTPLLKYMSLENNKEIKMLIFCMFIN